MNTEFNRKCGFRWRMRYVKENKAALLCDIVNNWRTDFRYGAFSKELLELCTKVGESQLGKLPLYAQFVLVESWPKAFAALVGFDKPVQQCPWKGRGYRVDREALNAYMGLFNGKERAKRQRFLDALENADKGSRRVLIVPHEAW